MHLTVLGHAGLLIRFERTSILCDPWFTPAYLGSWFPFPRNDRLAADVLDAVAAADFLYVSHQHADHFDRPWLRAHVDPGTPVLLPDFATGELERDFRELGFTSFVRTRDGVPLEIAPGVHVAIHVETTIADGPGGDSALVAWDARARIVDQNDCRVRDPAVLRAHGPVDVHALQFSGANWYPMAYRMPEAKKRRLAREKVAAQFERATRYVRAAGARVVLPSAGPPCFLDDDLFELNVVSGSELSIFPDQASFCARLAGEGIGGCVLGVPGSVIEVSPDAVEARHPAAAAPDPFTDKAAYLAAYRDDWRGWLEAAKASWPVPASDALAELRAWWEPLLALAPALGAVIEAPCLIASGDDRILVDFARGTVAAHTGGDHGFRFDIPRPLLEIVIRERAVDWSNALFLSCRFEAWRAGAYNEFLLAFFKSLSAERMARLQAEALRSLEGPAGEPGEVVAVGGYLVQRRCPHRLADLGEFGTVDGDDIVCTAHGWRFRARDGACLTAPGHVLDVRPR